MIENKAGLNGWIIVAGLLGLSAVALGAVAAHVIADSKAVASLEKAAIYQLIHVIVLLFLVRSQIRFAQACRWLFLTGIILFCGSIEMKYLLDIQGATRVAPAGGVFLMLGWVVLGVSGVCRNEKTAPSPSNMNPQEW